MYRSAMIRQQDRRGGGGKGAHNRETLPTTGRTTRIVIVPRELAPIPATPAGLPIPMAIRMRFLRHDGIYRSDVVQVKTETKPWGGAVPPPAGRPRAQVKERVGRTTLSSSSAMSSGRLFLDRGARQHCPSPLRRQGQDNLIARSEETNYHRTVSSVLTVCVSSGGKCNQVLRHELSGGVHHLSSRSRPRKGGRLEAKLGWIAFGDFDAWPFAARDRLRPDWEYRRYFRRQFSARLAPEGFHRHETFAPG